MEDAVIENSPGSYGNGEDIDYDRVIDDAGSLTSVIDTLQD